MPEFDIPGFEIAEEDWRQAIIRRIPLGRVLPIISDVVCHDLVFGSYRDLMRGWARSIRYPFGHIHPLSRMTQFHRVISRARRGSDSPDYVGIKELYLKFLEAALFSIVDGGSVATLRQEVSFPVMTLTQKAERLGCPPEGLMHAFSRLAHFPLPIYLTTSCHTFLEIALEREGKTPRPEICYWNDSLRSIPSVFGSKSLLDPTREYEPEPNEPLVYHLFGLDAYPESLVLTEDDHLDFLAKVAGGQGIIPLGVQRALSSFSIILLGYHLHEWDFKVIFRGLIIPNDMGNRANSVAIQLSPESKHEQDYLQHYLAQEASFTVHWGDTGPFVEELWATWVEEPGAPAAGEDAEDGRLGD